MNKKTNIMEGNFNHYKTNDINIVIQPINKILRKIYNIVSSNQKLNLIKIKNEFNMNEDKKGVIYTPIDISFNDEYLKTAHEKEPLSLRYIITRGVEQSGEKNATYSPMKKLITLRTDIEDSYINTYNDFVEKISNNEEINEKEFQQAKRDIYFYIHPYLLKMVLVHEMTHWLDHLYDSQIFETSNKNWIEITSEKNAILHQVKLIHNDSSQNAWDNTNIIDLLIMIRIRRDFLDYVLRNYLSEPKNWISEMIQLFKENDLPTENLLNINHKKLFEKGSIINDRTEYQKHYFKKHFEKNNS